ncbi:MAG: conserved phage C-terminal domain-containing protein [Holdemanella sp.]|nr:conserved phage C-terminal domain-containing protein [Holdemanella sp.]
MDSLDNNEGCTASNHHLASICQCSERQIIRILNRLKEKEHIYINNPESNIRTIRVIDRACQNVTEGVTKCHYRNNNRIYIYNVDLIREVIDYLNIKTGKKFRDGIATKNKIQARINEGYTIDEFRKVIDVKADEWKGTDMDKYLRPETLFGTKFDGYLNQIKMKDESEDEPEYYTVF